MTTALLILLAAAASAQSPMPYSGDQPAASTAPAVAASTEAAVAASTEAAVVTSTAGVHAAGEAKPKLVRPIKATIHAEAKDWEPISVRAGGDPFQVATKVVLKQEKVRGKYKGTSLSATAVAHLRRDKNDRWLVISIFPKLLTKRRQHFEVKFRLMEGFVEDVKASVVEVVDPHYTGAGMDSFELRERGVEFLEDSPGSGEILVAALDPKASKTAFNAGVLKRAAFADWDVRLADVSWSVKGLSPEK